MKIAADLIAITGYWIRHIFAMWNSWSKVATRYHVPTFDEGFKISEK